MKKQNHVQTAALTSQRSHVQIVYRPPSQAPQKQAQYDINEVLQLLLSPSLTEQLRLRRLDNNTLFDTYINELRLRNLSQIYIKKVWELLRVFKEYLKEEQPTPQLAKMFLSQYVTRKQNTVVRYFTYVNSFMTWYGAGLDYKPKAPSNVPPYHTKEQINCLVEATKNKKTHKKLARRDALIIELATTTGMRRSELANLLVGEIDFEHRKIQITGKGNKTRTIPLVKDTARKLERFCKNRPPNERVFGLKPACLSGQIRKLAKKAGVDLHTHSLRHYFGTRLVEKGANLRAVQELMGHASLNTTQIYVGVTAKHLEDAIKLLE